MTWRVSLPSAQSELGCFSSINLSHAHWSSLISHRDIMPPHLSENLNRVAWVKAILPMPRSGNSHSKLGLEQVRSLVVINKLCPVYIRDWSQMLHWNSKCFSPVLSTKGICWQLCCPALRSSESCWGEAEGTWRLLIVSFSRKWRRTVEGSSIRQFHRTCWATALTVREKGNQVRTASRKSHELVYLKKHS